LRNFFNNAFVADVLMQQSLNYKQANRMNLSILGVEALFLILI